MKLSLIALLTGLFISSSAFANTPLEICNINQDLKVVYVNPGRAPAANQELYAIVHYDFNDHARNDRDHYRDENYDEIVLEKERISSGLVGSGKLKNSLVSILGRRSLRSVTVSYFLSSYQGGRYISSQELEIVHYNLGEDVPDAPVTCYLH